MEAMTAGHANVVSCFVGSGAKEWIKFQRLRRYGSRRAKVMVRQASHLPVDEALMAVVASKRQAAWIKRFVGHLVAKGFPKSFSRMLAESSIQEATDDLTPEELAQEELYAMAS